jgi:hypothetical protein
MLQYQHDVSFSASIEFLEGRDKLVQWYFKSCKLPKRATGQWQRQTHEGSYLDPLETEKANGFNVVGTVPPGSDGIIL